MRLDELQLALEKVDPAAVLVPPGVLDYLIQTVGKLPAWKAATPHRECFTVDRQMLFLYFNQEELGLEPDRLLPGTLILLPRPAPDELKNSDRGALLLDYWRRLFHARVHLALVAEGKLSPDQVQARIAEIGAAEFAEIRQVLDQERYLLPEADDSSVYVEFAAVYLELRHFAPLLLPDFFPGIRDRERIDRLLAEDVNAAELFQHTRPSGTAEPAAQLEIHVDEAHQYFRKLMGKAEQAIGAGNTVRAAILQRQAARVAPDPPRMEAEAEQTLKTLVKRLQTALPLAEADVDTWHKNLSILLDKADQGARPVEAALLFDLQKLCLEHERDIFVLDLVGCFLSMGKQPIKRSLPRQKPVLIIRHLRNAMSRLARARLSDQDREQIGQMLQKALAQREERLRTDFRGILISAFQDAGLQPRNLPERAAFHKLTEEILDRIIAEGFITFGDLRDAISRNQLKLADLADPQAFVRGDNLLRLDNRLAALLDGVYRRSEAYVRWLERLSALSFGTTAGRFITYYVTLPIGGSFLLLAGLSLIFWPEPSMPEADSPATDDMLRLFGHMPLSVFLPLFLVLSGFFQALLHKPGFRHGCAEFGRQAWRGTRALFIDFPIWLIQATWLRLALKTWSFQLFYWYVFKPLVICAVVWYFRPDFMDSVFGMLIVFLAANSLLNSRPGHAVAQAFRQAILDFFDLLRAGLIPALIRLIVSVFREFIHLMEYVLAIVDEWLLFRTGQGQAMLVTRALLGVLWFPVSYIGRFYMVVLIEPGINPVKLPISSFAAKFLYPFLLVQAQALDQLPPVAKWIVVATAWLLPDAFGFLIWELKENWSLFAANRSRFLRPVPVGPHGETLPRLLRPGFHSGTLPKLFARLRQVQRQAHVTGNWNAVREHRRRLDEVAEAVMRFTERDLVFFVQQANRWDPNTLTMGPITLSTNQIGIEIRHRGSPRPLHLNLEERSGRLLASITEAGWLAELPEPQIRAFNSALAGFYEFAGVELVEDSLPMPAAQPGPAPPKGEHVVWMDHQHGQPVFHAIAPIAANGVPAADANTLSCRLLFSQAPLTWDDFVRSWEPRPIAANGSSS